MFLLRILATVIPLINTLSAAAAVRDSEGIRIPIRRRDTIVKYDRSIDAQALRAEIAHVQTRYTHAFARYEANTGERHPLDEGRNRTIQERATTPVPGATEMYTPDGYAWAGTIKIGTPAKSFSLNFDTGSSDLIIADSGCESCNPDDLHHAYNPGEPVWIDHLIHRASMTNRATGVSFKAAFANAPADGILGLAWPSLSAFKISGYKPFFNSLIAQGTVKQGVIGVVFDEVPGAEVCLGCIHDTFPHSTLGYTALESKSFWQIALNSITVNQKSKAVGSSTAIIDTGTSLIFGPKAAVYAIYAHFPGAQDASDTIAPGAFTFPCAAASLPGNLTFTFPGGSYLLPGEVFLKGPIKYGSKTCLGTIAYHSDNYWLLGAAWLNWVYTVFDMDHARVGFAKLG
ncbi:hypothetical protein HWV62_10128 [Athelia sp. TMB]|nr:hypothetical protein HWV62_10128 [Athelia sp. TMB]